jgi:hypothetical protein
LFTASAFFVFQILAMLDVKVAHHKLRSLMGLILLILVVLLLVGGLPRWGYSRNWGYGPSGGLGLVLIVLLVLVLMGRL